MIFARFFDFLSLVLSNLLTLGGAIRWTSANEAINKRNPARFMRWNERKRMLNQFNGGFLLDGKIGRFSQKTSFQSIITTGGMGVGKSANLVIPNILTAKDCSLVITDTSGEIYAQTSGYLHEQGYTIQVLDLMDFTKSTCYNPLANIHDYTGADRVAHTIVNSAGGHSAEPIWDEGAKRIIRILIRTLKNHEQKTGTPANLGSVLYLLNNFDAHREGSQLMNFILENTLDDRATYEDYKGFITASTDKMLLSFVSTASTALTQIGNPELSKILTKNEFSFDQLKHEKIALFIKVKQQDMQHFAFLLSLFYTDLCHALLQDLTASHPTYLFLDEFGHLKIPHFETFATTARKYKVGFWLFVQSLSQLEMQYGRYGAETILGGLGTETYFGGVDIATAQNISQRLGTAFKVNWLRPNDSPSAGNLMRADEIIRLNDNQMLVLHANRDPMKIHTLPFYARGDLKHRAKMPPHPMPARDHQLFIPTFTN